MQELVFRTHPSTVGFIVKQINTKPGGESIDYVVHFRPFLARKTASETRMEILYNKKHLFNLPVVADGDGDPHQLTIWKNQLEYELYETHQLKIDAEKDLVEAMFVSIDDTPKLVVNMKQTCIPRIVGLPERAIFLNWFPPNIDPAQYGLKIDTREIPQKSALWFKLRGEVSGTKAYALLGFFVPSKQADKDYSFTKPAVFSEESKNNMRLGNASEEYIIICYLHVFPDRNFYEVGWCPLPAGYPCNWGASPDGIVSDPAMTWAKINAALAADKDDVYTEAEMKKYDITKGACEFKTSRMKTCMEPYFIAQVYMEMMALNVVWCDLVRYRPDEEARVYRIYRSKKMEARMLKLWKYAYQNHQRLQDVVMEPDFVAIRASLKEMAAASQPYKVVRINADNALLEKFQNYTEYLASFEKVLPPVEEEDETHVERAKKIARLERDPDGGGARMMIELIAAQMQDYGKLLQNFQTRK